MREFNPAFRHHLDQISKAEFEPKVPTHTEDDDFPVEMAAIKELVNTQHVGHFPSGHTVRRDYAKTSLFAPQPIFKHSSHALLRDEPPKRRCPERHTTAGIFPHQRLWSVLLETGDF
jgi:hypothetical protein